MRVWGFRRTQRTDSDLSSGEHRLTTRERIRQSQFLADVQDGFPKRNRANARKLLLFSLMFILCIVLFALMLSLLPVEEFKDVCVAFGYPGVFLANFLSSMGVIFPTPPGSAVTIIVASAGDPLWAGIAAGIGGTLGEFTAYYIGYGGQRFLRFQDHHQYQVADRWMNNYGGAAITFCAFCPLFLFDFVGIAAGALKYPFHKFIFFSILGRVPRAIIEAYAGATFFEFLVEQSPDWINVPFVD